MLGRRVYDGGRVPLPDCKAVLHDLLVRNCDRSSELAADAGRDPARLREAVELVEDTRVRFKLNVSEELACEALAYRLERVLCGT